jgi:hypothetical protein
MKHHDNIRTPGKRGGIAVLLVPSVSAIFLVPDRVDA